MREQNVDFKITRNKNENIFFKFLNKIESYAHVLKRKFTTKNDYFHEVLLINFPKHLEKSMEK